MASEKLYPRFSKQLLLDAITDTPVILIHGSRQCGKTTLATQLGNDLDYHYLSFDDDTLREAALSDPIGLLRESLNTSYLMKYNAFPGYLQRLKPVLTRTENLDVLY